MQITNIPAGHTYYYNASTKQSTYTRPSEPPATVGSSSGSNSSSIPAINPSQSFLQYQAVGSLDPGYGPQVNNFGPQSQPDGSRASHHAQREGRGGYEQNRDRRPQPIDKPKSKHHIPGCEPWILVHTKLGRRFVYNPDKNQSYWRIPDKLKDGILALDQQRIKEKAEALVRGQMEATVEEAPGAAQNPARPTPLTGSDQDAQDNGEDISEYEEVEVTDDEEDENAPKRQRTEDPTADDPVEFNEDDIAFQLAAMGQDYGLEPDEYGDGNMEDWEDGAEGDELTQEDSSALFKDLLNDSGMSPYSPWDKIVEEGKLVDDTRYTALTSMKARKEVWEEWSRDKIKQLREQRAKEEKKDFRIPYLAFLQKHATPKLYWPEFKRKYKKEPEMRDATLSDKDRENWYRGHINRLKLPQSTLKTDLLNLLKSQPLSVLNNTTLPAHLPPAILTDIKYISIEPDTRDPLIEAFIATLPLPPLVAVENQDEDAMRERTDRERRQKALEERERRVSEEKRRQRRNLELGKGRLREEEADIARAMNVTKKGLKDHLLDQEKG
jgi:hypothetical protein